MRANGIPIFELHVDAVSAVLNMHIALPVDDGDVRLYCAPKRHGIIVVRGMFAFTTSASRMIYIEHPAGSSSALTNRLS